VRLFLACPITHELSKPHNRASTSGSLKRCLAMGNPKYDALMIVAAAAVLLAAIGILIFDAWIAPPQPPVRLPPIPAMPPHEPL
jgi:hypothetical protein